MLAPLRGEETVVGSLGVVGVPGLGRLRTRAVAPGRQHARQARPVEHGQLQKAAKAQIGHECSELGPPMCRNSAGAGNSHVQMPGKPALMETR